MKLTVRHLVKESEIEQCFLNRAGSFLEDTREEHLTDPPTQWFIAETDTGGRLKVVFIQKNGNTIIRTTYEPNTDEECIYNIHGK